MEVARPTACLNVPVAKRRSVFKGDFRFGRAGGVVGSCVTALASGARRGAHTMPVEMRAKLLGRPGIL